LQRTLTGLTSRCGLSRYSLLRLLHRLTTQRLYKSTTRNTTAAKNAAWACTNNRSKSC
jgi:hypothetical protein